MKATEMRKRGIELAEKARALRGPIRVPQWEHSSSIIESALNHAKSTKELLGPIYVPELGTDTEAAPVYTRPQTLGEYTTMLFEGKKNGRNLETQVSHLMLDEDGARIFTSAYIDELTMFSNVAINRIYSDLQRLKNKTTDDNTGTAIYYRNITVGMDRTL
ncbi:MAG: hypothetical protein GY938_12830, partial [Ketobacter sp.]|nr:hypothetical protein [Ketobacter sp.]